MSARRGACDALGLEHATDRRAGGGARRRVVEVGEEAERAEQRAGVERGDVGAVALSGLEHAQRREGAHALAQRPARDAELSGEVLLDREPGAGAQSRRRGACA